MVGSIKDLKDVNLLRNDMEFLLTSDGIGCVGIDTSLLPVVVLNGKAYQYTRQELIDFAYEQLTKEQGFAALFFFKSSVFSNIFGVITCVLPGNMLYLMCK